MNTENCRQAGVVGALQSIRGWRSTSSRSRDHRLYGAADSTEGGGGGEGTKPRKPGTRSRGAGPRNRRMGSEWNKEEEELFASLSAAIGPDPSRQEPGASDGEDNGVRPAATKKRTKKSTLTTLSISKKKKQQPIQIEEEEDDMPIQVIKSKVVAKPKKKIALSSSPRASRAPAKEVVIAGKTSLAEVVRQMNEANEVDGSAGKATSLTSEYEESEEDDDDDDDDDDPFAGDDDTNTGLLSKKSKIKVVDLNWDGKHSDDELSDYDSDAVAPSLGMKPMSMEERLRQAQGSSGSLNPWIAAQFGGGGAKSAQKGARAEPRWDEDEPVEEEKYKYKLVLQASTCPGCGNSFQTKDESVPGYLPKDIYERVQAQRKEQEAKYQKSRQKDRETTADYEVEMMAKKMKGKGGKGDDGDLFQGLSAEDEIEMLVKDGIDPLSGIVDVVGSEGVPQSVESSETANSDWSEDEDAHVHTHEEGDDEDDDKMVICQRCHRLKHYGQVCATFPSLVMVINRARSSGAPIRNVSFL